MSNNATIVYCTTVICLTILGVTMIKSMLKRG